MNAKKIMGAVLVALLAAALFVGAGAAVDYQTVFLDQELPAGVVPDGTYSLGSCSIAIVDGKVTLSKGTFVEGKYTGGGNTVYVTKPYAVLEMLAGSPAYKVGTLYTGDELKINASNANGYGNLTIDKVFITYPSGKQIDNGSTLVSFGNQYIAINDSVSKNLSAGTYKVQILFDKSGFVPGIEHSKLLTAPVTFAVAKSTPALKVSVETVTVGDIIKLEITGKPNTQYTVDGWKDQFKVESGVYTLDANNNIILPNDGNAYLNLKANKDGTAKITIKGNNGDSESLSVKVSKGTLTIKADKDAYFIGDKVKLSGIVTGGDVDSAWFEIKGPNYEDKNLGSLGIKTEGNDWKAEYQSTTVDAGTYTITLHANGDKVSTSIALKQPFISITDVPAVAVKGNDYKVKGTVEAANKVYAYIFGTNFFAAGTSDINGSKSVGKIGSVSVDDDEREFTLKLTDIKMDAGQYFLVVQHPMYDEKFNIAPETNETANGGSSGTAIGDLNVTGKIVLVSTGDATTTAAVVNNTLFDALDRQTTNAAQALCDALDSQNIDDRYVKASFIVAAATSVINPIPSEITKGSMLTVSGSTNLGEGETVAVEMISTAFGAQPKELVGSASFISINTKTDKDGNWEVTFNTSSLNVDEYTVSVAVADLDKTSAKINVIEGAPVQPTTTETQPTQTEQPTQPTQTPQPTTPPKTPGFGALAALAGLGAVAVLLLRRE